MTRLLPSPPPPVPARAIVRISGPKTFAVVSSVFRSVAALEPKCRSLVEGELHVPDLACRCPPTYTFGPARTLIRDRTWPKFTRCRVRRCWKC